MRKLSQKELVTEGFSDIMRGIGKVASKAAVSGAKGLVGLVTPTGRDILKNVKTGVQKAVSIFTKEQAGAVARKYLEDKYESQGSMFNVKEIKQFKGSLQGKMVPLTDKEKKAETAPPPAPTTTSSSSTGSVPTSTSPTTTSSSSSGSVPIKANYTATPGNASVTEQVSPQAKVVNTPSTQPQQQPETQQQKQDKIQAQQNEAQWPFRYVVFEADMLVDRVAGNESKRKKEGIKPGKDEYKKHQFAVKLTKTNKDGEKEWTVLGLTNPDGSRFTGISEELKDNKKVENAPVSYKEKPKEDFKVGDRVKWQSKRTGQVNTGTIINNKPNATIKSDQVTVEPDGRGGATVFFKKDLLKESLSQKDILSFYKLFS
jgi:hypothetical protein